MGKTVISIASDDFLINGNKTYSEIPGSNAGTQGLLMNARFIQGVFDDKADPARFNRFGKIFNPDQNTDDLIASLPQWRQYGLRAFTVGLQGGGPCFTTDNATIDNNPYGQDGLSLDPDKMSRLDRLVRAADEIGMAVIVSLLYPGQLPRLRDESAVFNAVRGASAYLREQAYTNVLIEVCNEMDVDKAHSVVHDPAGMTRLIAAAREFSGGMLVSCSFGGGVFYPEVGQASDFVLIHGNACTRQQLYNLIQIARRHCPGKPIVCNEDSSALGQIPVCLADHVSWGYYNNMTKQEPPADWSVTTGEDLFFASRMAAGLGIVTGKISENDQYVLQSMILPEQGKYWLRLACLHPELVDRVEYYLEGKRVFVSYDEPFMLNQYVNFYQTPWQAWTAQDHWLAEIHLRDGRILERVITLHTTPQEKG